MCKLCMSRHCNGCENNSNFFYSVFAGRVENLEPIEITYPTLILNHERD